MSEEELKEMKEGEIPEDVPGYLYEIVRKMAGYQRWVAEEDLSYEADYDINDPSLDSLIRPLRDETVSRKEVKEFAWMLGIDHRMHILFIDLLSLGNIHKTMTLPWVVLRSAFFTNISAFVFCHNRLGSNLEPSEADLVMTREMIEAGMKLGRPMLDHIIFNEENFYSMALSKDISRLAEEVRLKLDQGDQIRAQAELIAKLQAEIKTLKNNH